MQSMIETVIPIVREHGILARMRFSRRQKVARLDLFTSSEILGVPLVADLIEAGWQLVQRHETPDDLYGFEFSHEDQSEDNLAKARAIMRKHHADRGAMLKWSYE